MKRVIIILAVLACGCAERIRIPPKAKLSPVNNQARWVVLAYLVENHFDTTGWTIEEIAAELSLQAYLMSKK